jgi:two-component system response regulator PilR (NtrC family)
MRRLEAHDFPGNVRELENIIERAVALASGPLIGSDDLPEVRTTQPPAAAEVPAELPADGVDLDRLVSDFERAWVMRALERTGGIRKRAAVLLGISFRSLRYRLDKLGIEKTEDKPDERDDKSDDDAD